MFAALLCGVVAAVSSCSPDETEEPPTGTISGIVTDVEGVAMSGVTVTVSGTGLASPVTTTTASDGSYSVADLAIAAYTVKFSKSSFQEVNADIVAYDFRNNNAAVKNVTLISAIYKISGTIIDEAAAPLEGVSVVVSNALGTETVGSATTATDGTYTVELAAAAPYGVAFSKAGYKNGGKPVTAGDFVKNTATADATLMYAAYTISGTVINSDGQPIGGADVTIASVVGATTAADGTFSLEVPSIAAYTVTFSKAGYDGAQKSVAAGDFVVGIAAVGNVNVGSVPTALAGQTIAELKAAPKLLYNWYRAGNDGNNGGPGNLWDWSTGYMIAAMPVYGRWEAQNEGMTVRIKTTTTETNTNVFDSYVYGRKKITADNNIMSVKVRTHSTSATTWGVQVVDLSAANPVAMKITANGQSLANITTNNNWTDYSFDLSKYIGKEVIIAVGTYMAGNNDLQLVLRSVYFSTAAYSGWQWPAIAAADAVVLPSWQLSKQMLRSTEVQTGLTFTGKKNSSSGDFKVVYPIWYSPIDTFDHIAKAWSFVPAKKDAEPLASEGLLIKTLNETDITLLNPSAYLYAKFNITAANNQMKMWVRNFSGTPTYFKVTAIKDDFTYTHLPVTASTTATAASTDAAWQGAWRFVHNTGSSGNLGSYGTLTFDLSAYVGQTVTIAIGVYSGPGSVSGEYKLVFRQIEFSQKP